MPIVASAAVYQSNTILMSKMTGGIKQGVNTFILKESCGWGYQTLFVSCYDGRSTTVHYPHCMIHADLSAEAERFCAGEEIFPIVDCGPALVWDPEHEICLSDSDGDGVMNFDAHDNPVDNCPQIPNLNQADRNNNGIGDA